MSVDSKEPEIRFKGFSGYWEKKHLNHEVELFSGLTYSPKDIREKGVFVIRSSNVKNGQIVQADNVYVNPEVINCSNVQKGDIIVVVRNGSRSLIGKHAQINTCLDNTVIGAFMTGVRSDSPEFINALFDTNKFTAQVEKNLGATINQITNGAFNSMVFMFPEDQEKTAIGNFFQKLDALINQHQQKHDKLNSIKKSMLEKMFPKKGKVIPEIRFGGFSNDWFEVKLGEIARIKGRLGWKSLKQNEYLSEGPAMIAGKHIENGHIDWSKVDHIPEWRYIESPEIILKNGDVIFSKDGSLGNPAVVSNLQCKATINSTMMLVRPSNNLDSNFFYQVLNTKPFKELIKEKVSGSSIPHLFQADMKLFKFYSTSLEEQYKIGIYFKQIDSLINQHQQQITKLNNIKQACLSKMFV